MMIDAVREGGIQWMTTNLWSYGTNEGDMVRQMNRHGTTRNLFEGGTSMYANRSSAACCGL